MRLDDIYRALLEDMSNQIKIQQEKTKLAPMRVKNEIGKLLQDANKRYAAAIEGLAAAEKFKDPVLRRKHKSRVMSNLNTLRALVNRISKLLG